MNSVREEGRAVTLLMDESNTNPRFVNVLSNFTVVDLLPDRQKRLIPGLFLLVTRLTGGLIRS